MHSYARKCLGDQLEVMDTLIAEGGDLTLEQLPGSPKSKKSKKLLSDELEDSDLMSLSILSGEETS